MGLWVPRDPEWRGSLPLHSHLHVSHPESSTDASECPSPLGASQDTSHSGPLPETSWEGWPRHSMPEGPVHGG